MPWVVNGIGTWYWGKRNIHKEGGVCEFCNAFCELTSYDATLYFVIVFIPIIPLGKKRILNQCAQCERHRVIKLKEWYLNKAKSIEDALNQFRASPTPENLESTLNLLIAYQDQQGFENLAQSVEKQMGTNVALLNTLGDGYEKFGNLTKAESTYRQSIQLAPSANIQNILGRVLLLQNRPDEAKSVLQRILTEKKLDEIGYLFLLVEGFQAQGRHQEALDILSACKNTFPEIEKDVGLKTELGSYQHLAEKYLAKNKKIKAPHLITSDDKLLRRGEWKASIPGLVVLGLFFLIIFSYLSSAYTSGSQRQFFLVNGLHRPYRLSINGQERTLSPTHFQEIFLPEGTIQFQIQDPDITAPPQFIQVETPFWSRPFSDYTFVINPDQTAILIRDEIIYATKHDANDKTNYELFTGENFYKFEGLDFKFVEFPATYTIPSKTSKVRKTRVGLYSMPTPEENISILWDQKLAPETRINYFKRQLSFMPNQETYLSALSAVLTPEETLSFVKPKLEARPVFVAWHRLYQDLMLQHHPEVSMIQEYQNLCDKEPENGDLTYLLGNITPQFHQAKILFQKAIQQKTPSREALYSLALQELSSGNFPEALKIVRQAKNLKVRPFVTEYLFREILMASQQYEELLLSIQTEQRKNATNGEWIAEEVLVLTRSGKQGQISKTTNRFIQDLSKASWCTPQILNDWKTYFRLIESYVQRDHAQYLEQLKKMNDPSWSSFQIALLENRLEDAWQMAQNEQQSVENDLLLGLLCKTHQKTELERTILQAVIDTFKTSSLFSERVLAEMLTGKRQLTAEDIVALPILPKQKVPLLILLSEITPEHRDRYFALAKKLNYSARFPCWIYQEMLEKK